MKEHRILNCENPRKLHTFFFSYLKTICDDSWIYSYTSLTWNNFLVCAILSFDLKTTFLPIVWGKPPLSVHHSNHYSPLKEETHKDPDSSQAMESFVSGVPQVQMFDYCRMKRIERYKKKRKRKTIGCMPFYRTNKKMDKSCRHLLEYHISFNPYINPLTFLIHILLIGVQEIDCQRV